MENSTAGIGIAESLINKTPVSRDMPLTRGLQMAETSALKKAQLEAQKAAKLQAKQDRIDKLIYGTKTGNYNYKSSYDEARNHIKSAVAQMESAGDNVEEIYRIKGELDDNLSKVRVKDKVIYGLEPSKNTGKVNTKEVWEAAKSGKLDDYISKQPWYNRDIIAQDESGDVVVNVPKNVNLDKEFQKTLAASNPDLLSYEGGQYGTFKLKKQFSDNELTAISENLIDDPENDYNRYLNHSIEFQSFYAKKYGDAENPEILDKAKVEFTKSKLSKYNSPEYQVRALPKGKSSFEYRRGTGGFELNGFQFAENEKPASEYILEISQEKYRHGVTDSGQKDAMIKSLGGVNSITEVVLPQNISASFEFSDESRGGAAVRVKPETIFGANGRYFVTYKDDNKIRIAPLNQKIVQKLASYYKTDVSGIIKAFGEAGIDFSGYKPKSQTSVPKPANKPAGKKAGESYIDFNKRTGGDYAAWQKS